jgi:hypothetical protein
MTVELVLSVISGAYQTSLLTYFIQRDLFPALIKVRTCTTRDDRKSQLANGLVDSSYKIQKRPRK